MNMELPSAEDLAGSPPRTLDEDVILDHFLGKTREEIRALLPTSGHFQEDFMWMWPLGLRYYLPAVLDYLHSQASKNDYAMSQGLLCSLSFQVTHKQLSNDVLEVIASIAEYVNVNRTKFFPTGIEGSLLERYLADIRAGTRPR